MSEEYQAYIVRNPLLKLIWLLSFTWILFLEGAGPVVAGVFSAIFVLAVLVLMYHCCKQKNKLGYLKPLALPSTLRQQFRYDGGAVNNLGFHLWITKLFLSSTGENVVDGGSS